LICFLKFKMLLVATGSLLAPAESHANEGMSEIQTDAADTGAVASKLH
jgi:hypothetical protein